MAPRALDIHLTEINGYILPPEVKKLLKGDLLNGKGYDACHHLLQAETGIWIPELEQVFKDMDTLLGLPAYQAKA